jgi:hypothetical protein
VARTATRWRYEADQRVREGWGPLEARNYGGGATYRRRTLDEIPARQWRSSTQTTSGLILDPRQSSREYFQGQGAAERRLHDGAGVRRLGGARSAARDCGVAAEQDGRRSGPQGLFVRRRGDLGVRARGWEAGVIPGRGSRPCGRDRCAAEGKGLASGPGWSEGAAWCGRSAELLRERGCGAGRVGAGNWPWAELGRSWGVGAGLGREERVGLG